MQHVLVYALRKTKLKKKNIHNFKNIVRSRYTTRTCIEVKLHTVIKITIRTLHTYVYKESS